MTKADLARFERIVACGCMACRFERVEQPNRTEAHHLLSGGFRRGHKFSIPLCQWHHRGIPRQGWNTATTRDIFGPSLRLESRAFHERYGADDELLVKVNAMIDSNRDLSISSTAPRFLRKDSGAGDAVDRGAFPVGGALFAGATDEQ